MTAINFKSSKERSTWAKSFYAQASFTQANLSNNDILAKMHLLNPTFSFSDVDLKIIIQICKQKHNEKKNQKAQRLGYESNITCIDESIGLSRQELKYYNVGKKYYKSDTISPTLKNKIRKGLIKWVHLLH